MIVRAVLSGEKSPQRDVVVVNAAAAIMAGSTSGTGGTRALKQSARIAEDAIDSGRALEKLEQLIKLSQGFARGK